MALSALREIGSQPIEWGALLEYQMHAPRIVKNFSYTIASGKLESASEMLKLICLPLMPATRFLLCTEGDFRAKGHLHRVTHSTNPASIQHLVLYPRSFVPLLPDHLEDVLAIHMQSLLFSPRILALNVSSRTALHMRMLLACPNMGPTRMALEASLASLIHYDLLDLEDGCCPNIEDGDEYWDARYPDLPLKR